MICELDKQIASLFPNQAAAFDAMMCLQGERFRQLEGRTTARVLIAGKPYFIKQHRGVGWREIFKNLFQGRLPILGARHEYLALQRLASLGLAAPRVMGYGERGLNPATRESFILMEALDQTTSLETLCADWPVHPPSFVFKLTLIKAVAAIARTLHTNGMNHRDFYLCHFLLGDLDHDKTPLRLSLIDLHRAGIRSRTPERWVKKDLAGLYFSSKNIGLHQRDYYRFMRYYRARSFKSIMRTERAFWEAVKRLGEALYREHQ